ncbi:MAG: hypothetical protein ABW156_01295 [Jiangellaceae bacterium]
MTARIAADAGVWAGVEVLDGWPSLGGKSEPGKHDGEIVVTKDLGLPH